MSKVLIAYASKHGCTEECAKALAEKMSEGADLWNLKGKNQMDLNAYEKVILGGSIYAGHIQKEVKAFSEKNEKALKGKKLGLFTCCMSEGDVARKQLEGVFPEVLLDAAIATESFGGKIILNKINFMERKIVKMVAKVQTDLINLSESNLNQFAKTMNEA